VTGTAAGAAAGAATGAGADFWVGAGPPTGGAAWAVNEAQIEITSAAAIFMGFVRIRTLLFQTVENFSGIRKHSGLVYQQRLLDV
jgi:hypothetical protein